MWMVILSNSQMADITENARGAQDMILGIMTYRWTGVFVTCMWKVDANQICYMFILH